jgi:lycopene cyclase domain-containing protein
VKFVYLAILLFSISGMILIDYKYKLSFFKHARAATESTLIVMTILLVTDIIGVNWGIFSTNPKYVTGLFIGSENIPIEELFFLFLLCYFILNLNQILKRWIKND